MTVADLIEALEATIELHGNLPIYIKETELELTNFQVTYVSNHETEQLLDSVGLAEMFGFNTDRPDVYLEIMASA